MESRIETFTKAVTTRRTKVEETRKSLFTLEKEWELATQRCDEADEVLSEATKALEEMTELLKAAKAEKEAKDGQKRDEPAQQTESEGHCILQKFQELSAAGTALAPVYAQALRAELVKFPNLVAIMQAAAGSVSAPVGTEFVEAHTLQEPSTPLAAPKPQELSTPLAAARPSPAPLLQDGWIQRRDGIAARRAAKLVARNAVEVETIDDDETVDVRVTDHTDRDGRESKKTRITDPKEGHAVKIYGTVAIAHPQHVGQIVRILTTTTRGTQDPC